MGLECFMVPMHKFCEEYYAGLAPKISAGYIHYGVENGPKDSPPARVGATAAQSLVPSPLGLPNNL